MTERRPYLGLLTDNRRWDAIALRPDDVIVVAPPKSGTTWMQTIVALLLSGDADVEPDLSISMPWVDIRLRDLSEVSARLEAMTRRRGLKSHTPMDGLPLRDGVQYLCVFRHPLDAHFSFRNHVRNIPVPWFDPWYPGDDPDRATFRHFLEGEASGHAMDAMPLAHVLRHYQAARALSSRPNVTLFHYADMQRDLAGSLARVADLLGVTHPAAVMQRLVRAAGFDNMKRHAARYAPGGGKGFFRSDSAFFNSGRSGQWRGQLTAAEQAAYDAMMDAHLSPADRAWLEGGLRGPGSA